MSHLSYPKTPVGEGGQHFMGIFTSAQLASSLLLLKDQNK